MPTLLEDTRKQTLTTPKSGLWTATRVFTFTVGNGDPPLSDTLALQYAPQKNTVHPLNPYLTVTDVTVSADGMINMLNVTVKYEIAAYIDTTGGGNPFNISPKLRWRPSLEGERVDYDGKGNRITNSAGDAPADAPTLPYPRFTFSITRNEPMFLASTAINYMGKIASANVTINGFGGFNAGYLRCLFVGPTEDFYATSNFIPITYEFEARQDGFPTRIPDVGRRAYWTDDDGKAIIGRILDAQGNPVTIDVRLDGNGTLHSQALADGFTIEGCTGEYVGPGTPNGATIDTGPGSGGQGGGNGGDSTGAVTGVAGSADATYLCYVQPGLVDFNPLNLG